MASILDLNKDRSLLLLSLETRLNVCWPNEPHSVSVITSDEDVLTFLGKDRLWKWQQAYNCSFWPGSEDLFYALVCLLGIFDID